jgi:hypothetical protein
VRSGSENGSAVGSAPCESVNCAAVAVALVFWPGQTRRMCERCAARAAAIASGMGFTCDVQPFAEEAARPERPISEGSALDAALAAAGLAPHLRQNGTCDRCGAAPGAACDPAKHDVRSDGALAADVCICAFPRTTCPNCLRACHACSVAASSSLWADLAAWNRHQRGCHACTTAPTAANLCLAGAALWQRAGLEVIPVPARPAPPPPPIPGRLWPRAPGSPPRRAEFDPIGDQRHPACLRTSELLRWAAVLMEQNPEDPDRVDLFDVPAELRARAAYLETLGDHDSPRTGAVIPHNGGAL